MEWPGVDETEMRDYLTHKLERQAVAVLTLTGDERARQIIDQRGPQLGDEKYVAMLRASTNAVREANGDLELLYESQLRGKGDN